MGAGVGAGLGSIQSSAKAARHDRSANKPTESTRWSQAAPMRQTRWVGTIPSAD
jgi:hypothetical protein